MNYNHLEDRENDWLAKELRHENMKLKHSDYCEAKAAKEEHEEFHKSQIIKENLTKNISSKTKPTNNKSIIRTILIFYIIWVVISILISILNIL